MMKAISIRAPYWWFILHGSKDIENRSVQYKHRGPLLIHASKRVLLREIFRDLDHCQSIQENEPRWWTTKALDGRPLFEAGGCIVGVVDVVGCAGPDHPSPWTTCGGLLLANPRPFTAPIPYRGQQGLFNVPTSVVQNELERMSHGN